MIIRCPSAQWKLICSVIALTLLGLSACNRGGSGSSGVLLSAETETETGLLSDDAPNIDLLPNFAVQDVTMAPTYDRKDNLSLLLRVANTGEAAEFIPDAWLMVSETDDFSTGYAIYPFNLSPAGNDVSTLLEPGDERDFRAIGTELPLQPQSHGESVR